MSRQRVGIIEDDDAIRRGLADALDAGGYRTVQAADGDAGLQLALAEPIELLLLDLMLPGVGGLEILAQVRDARPALPVIILTAMGEENDRVKGLKMGADDYVCKPFGVRELLARVEAVLRRTPARPVDRPRFAIPGGQVDLEQGRIDFKDGRAVPLSEREGELLRYLAANAGRTVSRDEILLHVWQVRPAGIETRTIDVHVARLREKLGDDPADPAILKTVRGRGYMLDAGGRR